MANKKRKKQLKVNNLPTISESREEDLASNFERTMNQIPTIVENGIVEDFFVESPQSDDVLSYSDISSTIIQSSHDDESFKKEIFKNARIVAADDQLINIEVLQQQIETLGLTSTSDFCVNGQETIDTVQRIVNEALATRDNKQRLI